MRVTNLAKISKVSISILPLVHPFQTHTCSDFCCFAAELDGLTDINLYTCAKSVCLYECSPGVLICSQSSDCLKLQSHALMQSISGDPVPWETITDLYYQFEILKVPSNSQTEHIAQQHKILYMRSKLQSVQWNRTGNKSVAT